MAECLVSADQTTSSKDDFIDGFSAIVTRQQKFFEDTIGWIWVNRFS